MTIDIEAIGKRAEYCASVAKGMDAQSEFDVLVLSDVPAMIARVKHLELKISNIDNCRKVQSSPGCFDQGEYMRGLANGLIMAHAILTDSEPEYFAP